MGSCLGLVDSGSSGHPHLHHPHATYNEHDTKPYVYKNLKHSEVFLMMLYQKMFFNVNQKQKVLGFPW